MSASYDLHKAIVKVWDDFSLDSVFNASWEESLRSKFLVLNDSEAQPDQPWPYCVFSIVRSSTNSRSNGNGVNQVQEYRQTPLTFNVHARNTTTTSGKRLAAEAAEEITQIFGGHSTVKPKEAALTQGGVLNLQYLTDYGVRTGTEEYQWVIEYMVHSDIPMMVS